MRKWAWIGTGVALFLLWAILAQPQMRFQAAPEVPPQSGDGAAGPDLEAVRALGEEFADIELTRVERAQGGVIEVDATYTGTRPPDEQEEWNLLAKEIANHLTQSPANTQTVHVSLYHEGQLRAQGVTTRSE